MHGDDGLPLLARPLDDGAGWELCSPGVGLYAQAPPRGCLLGPGSPAGVLVVLERPQSLRVPEGLAGYVDSDPPERRHLPVGYGTPLFRLRRDARNGLPGTGPSRAAGPEASGLVLRAPQAGRFWRRPEPGADLYLEAGAELRAGRTLGLLEVMKTFNPVKYQPGGELPERARLLRFLVEDGADVEEGQALAELEAAEGRG